MGAIPGLSFARRPIQGRILAVYRLDPKCAAELVPSELRPRLVQGYAVGAACYTRLAASRLFGGKVGGSDHLAYRIAVEDEGGAGVTWIARRETSSWLEAQCGSKFLRGEYGRATFRVKDEAFQVELAVENEQGEEFYLRAETAPAPPNSLFASGHGLEQFLTECRAVRPYDLFAPEADELELAEHFAPEPLAVFEARSAFFGEGPLAHGAAVLDSAWRFVSRRLVGASERQRAFRVLPEPNTASPALPSV